MKTLIFLLTILTINCCAETFQSRFCGGVSLPIGAELGFLTESYIPIKTVKIFTKTTLIIAPLTSKYAQVVLIGSLQPGIRLKLIQEKLMISGGFSINPVAPLPFNGLYIGLGSFLGLSTRIENFEIGFYGTSTFSNEKYSGKISWFSFLISKSFPLSFQENK